MTNKQRGYVRSLIYGVYVHRALLLENFHENEHIPLFSCFCVFSGRLFLNLDFDPTAFNPFATSFEVHHILRRIALTESQRDEARLPK